MKENQQRKNSQKMSHNPFDEGDIEYDDALEVKHPSPTKSATTTTATSVAGVDLPYNASHFAAKWLYVAIICHVAQFAVLLSVDGLQLSAGPFILVVLLVLTVPILLIIARFLVTKKKARGDKRCTLAHPSSPDEETDRIPDSAIYLVSAAAVLEGVALAVYSVSVAGYQPSSVRNTVLQALRFASITLLCLQRILRPANRVDPMRTIMELEVVSVCWDALDGSTLFELIDNNSTTTLTPMSDRAALAARVLMGFWYLSVGFRLSLMLFTHLSADAPFYHAILPRPLHLSKQPTVDRTLQSMRLRAVVVLIMSM